jgi:SagB-type dehydrogenase family enzyme
MVKSLVIFIAVLFIPFILIHKPGYTAGEREMIKLPEPKIKGSVSLEEAIARRRSIREFAERDIKLEEVSQLLWAAQGITDKAKSFRAVPSAGALYPLEIYVVTREGLFRYIVEKHALEILDNHDLRSELSDASWGQEMVRQAGANIVICAIFKRVTSKYAERGIKYVYMEAGHAAQNIHLMAVSLGLGSVSVGAFDDKKVQALFKLDKNIEPLYIVPIGAKRD